MCRVGAGGGTRRGCLWRAGSRRRCVKERSSLLRVCSGAEYSTDSGEKSDLGWCYVVLRYAVVTEACQVTDPGLSSWDCHGIRKFTRRSGTDGIVQHACCQVVVGETGAHACGLCGLVLARCFALSSAAATAAMGRVGAPPPELCSERVVCSALPTAAGCCYDVLRVSYVPSTPQASTLRPLSQVAERMLVLVWGFFA